MPEPEGSRHQGEYILVVVVVFLNHLFKIRYKPTGSIKTIPGNLQSVSNLIDLDHS